MKDRCGFWVSVVQFTWMLLLGSMAMAEPSYGPVQAGETLWGIGGQAYAGSGLDRERIMLALVLANPASFDPPCTIQGILKAGTHLKLPAPEQVVALDAPTARAKIKKLKREWQTHRHVGHPRDCPTELLEVTKTGEPTIVDAIVDSVASATSPTDSGSPAIAERSEPEPSQPAGLPTAVPAGGDRPEHAGQGQEVQSTPAAGKGSTILPPGPRAPGWLLVVLLLALVTAAMLRWERRSTLVALSRSPSRVLEAATDLPRHALLWLAPGGRELSLLLLLAALAGFLGALVTILFRQGIHGLQWLVSGHSGGLVTMAMAMPVWERLLLPTAGGLVAGLVLEQIGQRLRGPRTTDYMEAIAVGDGWISVRHSLVKAVSSLFTVATGGSIGREGAMVQLAAMVASTLARFSRLPRDPMRFLVAAGAAAGLAAAYNAPIAATLFVAEIVLGSIAIDYIGPLIIAAVISNATVHDLFGYAPVYEIPAFRIVSDWELGLYLILGLLAGHTAPVFLQLLERSHRLFARLPMPLTARMTLGGLIVGAISIYEPQVWGNGYSVVNSVLHTPWVWQALLTVLVLKMLATAAVYGSGAIGGAFTPTLCVGALLGGTVRHPGTYGAAGGATRISDCNRLL
jgi:H+/Cl- antiporter ClcA